MAKHQTIWVVDDDSELRQLLSTYLGEQGYEVRTLNDGKQFTARLEFQRPDLVVLDLMMPGDDGLTILRRLRDGGDDLPVGMLTARGEAVDRIIGLEQGADDYLAKPFMPRELSARIDGLAAAWCRASRHASGRWRGDRLWQQQPRSFGAHPRARWGTGGDHQR